MPIKKHKLNPLFKGLPSRLKDPKVYLSVEKKLRAILKTDHEHKTMKAYANCEKCQINRMERQKLMKQEGFKSLEQYMEWKKIIGMIVEVRKLQNENKKPNKTN